MTRRRLLVPTLSTTVMLLLLLALGTWQVQRLAWKNALLARFAAAERDPAVPLAPGLPPFAKVSVSGHLRADRAVFYGAEVREAHGSAVLGAQLIVPLEQASALPLLVDLGWVPTGGPDRPAIPTGATRIEGYIRPAEHPGWFSAPDDPAGRTFYTLDPSAIGAALGMAEVAPYTLVALGPAPPEGSPDPARHLPVLPNNHLQYALTWYGLAVVLLVVFFAYVRKGAPA